MTNPDRSTEQVLALDFGGTKLAAGLVGVSSKRVERRIRVATPAGGAEASLAEMLRISKQLFDGSQSRIIGVGISFGGQVASDRKRVIRSVHIPGWESVDLVQEISDAFGVSVSIDNDANAAALAEWRFGAGSGAQNMAYVQLSTGVGAGLILNGRLYRGGGQAGEFGHQIVVADGPECVCGNRGCVESIAGGWAIARDGRAALQRTPIDSTLQALANGDSKSIDAKLVITAWRSGDKDASRILSRALGTVGMAVGNMINLLDPEIVVIGGGVAQAEDAVREMLPPSLARHVNIRVRSGDRLAFGVLGDDATLLGAAQLLSEVTSDVGPA